MEVLRTETQPDENGRDTITDVVPTAVLQRFTHGRIPIFTSKETITRENVVDILNAAYTTHSNNSADIEYLYNYYKGVQPILSRQKEIRPEINNKVVVNTASEIVSFKSGYLTGEPIQYISRSSEEKDNKFITELNDYMYVEDKAEKDSELSEWAYICGTSFRLIQPNKKYNKDDTFGDESPFKIYTLDPRYTFVIRCSNLENEVVAGVKYVCNDDGDMIFSVFTDTTYFEIKSNTIIKEETHKCGRVPIIEYPANNARLGAFELCLPLLDARNTIESNRVDGVEQFIQSLLVVIGVDMDGIDSKSLRNDGGLQLPNGADAKYLVQELNQTQIQALIDNIYSSILTISGMPSQGDGNTSDSSNNGAVIVRNGWQHAESRAKETVAKFTKSEKELLKIAFRLIGDIAGTKLIKLSSVDVKFTRYNFENLLVKAQVLAMLLSTEKIDPPYCFKSSGMFTDPEAVWAASKKYMEEKKAESQRREAENNMQNTDDGTENNNAPAVNNIGVEGIEE